MSMGTSWDKKCPVCGGVDVACQDEVVRYCNGCRFQWSLELGQVVLTGMARKYNEQQHAAARARGEEPGRWRKKGGG